MAGRDADALNIRGADALLAGGHAMPRRLLLAEKPFLHGGHAAVDQQQAGVILRNQREAAQAQVTLRLKIMQVLFAKLVQSGPLHRCCSPIHKIAMQGPPQKITAHAPIQDEGCYASVVPPGLQRRKNIIQQHCRFVSALTPQVRSALHRKLRGGSAVLPRESLAPNGFLSEGRNGRHWPFHRYFPFYRLIICRFVPLVN